MATVGVYSFEVNIASPGYRVFKETSWSKVQDGKEVKFNLETSQSSILTHTLVPFVLKSNISKDEKQYDTFQERYLSTCITLSERGSFCQWDSDIYIISSVTNISWWTRNATFALTFVL